LQNSEKLSKRYAKALLESCRDDNVESMREALQSLSQVWQTIASFREAVLNPANSREDLVAVIRDVAQQVKVDDQILLNFLLVLLENDRMTSLPQISTSFSLLVDALRKVLALEITSAFELSEAEKNDLQDKIKQQFGSLVSIKWKTDQKIIGGLLIQSGDKLIDRSLRGSLSSLRETLLQ